MEIIKPDTNLDFVGKRNICLTISAVLIFFSALGMFIWPKPRWGIDFAGGAAIQVYFKKPIEMSRLRAAVDSLHLGEVMLQHVASPEGQEGETYLIKVQRLGIEERELMTGREESKELPGASAEGESRPLPGETTSSPSGLPGSSVEHLPGATPAESSPPSAGTTAEKGGTAASAPVPGDTVSPSAGEAAPSAETGGEPTAAAAENESGKIETALQEATPIEKKLAEVFGADSFEILSLDFVGPKVGKELRNRGIMAVAFSLVLLLAYITLRFEFRFAVGAIVALFHDVMITTGALIFTQRDFNLTTVAALLTIVGYSINDTIVICDRIRENMRRLKRLSFQEMINVTINQTLSRTILTTLTTFLAVFFLWALGGSVIHDFAFAMMVGIITGTYSTIYIAAPIVIYWEDYRSRKRTPAMEMRK